MPFGRKSRCSGGCGPLPRMGAPPFALFAKGGTRYSRPFLSQRNRERLVCLRFSPGASLLALMRCFRRTCSISDTQTAEFLLSNEKSLAAIAFPMLGLITTKGGNMARAILMRLDKGAAIWVEAADNIEIEQPQEG